MFRVKDLKKALENADDEAIVCVDTEARCFNAHLIDIKNAFFESDEVMGLGDDLFILYPNYDGTTHYRNKGE